jgi:hypothetical protein
MNAEMNNWLAQAWATDSPVLPTAGAMQVWLHLGWSVVLAWLGACLAGRLLAGRERSVQVQWMTALALAAWAWVPGPGGAAYWLGLAFQAPSASSVLLSAALLVARLRASADRHATQLFFVAARSSGGAALWLAGMGALLGWALLLDSFAVLPLQLYAWGFSPAALFLVVVVALLPWVAGRGIAMPGMLAAGFAVPVAALVFVAWRLPTGNVWDAVLDPWAWLALQVWLLKRGWLRYKNNS